MKYYYSIINILLITFVIFFGVETLYEVFTARLDYYPTPLESDTSESMKTDTPIHPLRFYSNIADRNLFHTKAKSKPEPVVQKAPEKEEEPLQPTELNLKLFGTVTGNGSSAYAIILDPKERQQDLYAEGDAVQIATIKKIMREKVILTVNGKDEILQIEDDQKQSNAPRSHASNPFNPGGGATKKDIVIARAEIQNALKNVNNIMRQARIRPHFKNGKPDGLTITRIRGNSIFRRLGLRSGDVIVGVDGKKIETVDDALRFYNQLKNSSQASLEIKRRGRTQELNYRIR